MIFTEVLGCFCFHAGRCDDVFSFVQIYVVLREFLDAHTAMQCIVGYALNAVMIYSFESFYSKFKDN